MALLGAALAQILTADPAVFAIAGNRVSPLNAIERIQYPMITYQTVSGFRVPMIAGPSGYTTPRIQVDCWAETYDDAKALADAVRRALDGFSGTAASVSIQSSTLVNEIDFDADEGRIFRVSLDFSIHHLEAVA